MNFHIAPASYELCTLFQNPTLNCRQQIGQISIQKKNLQIIILEIIFQWSKSLTYSNIGKEASFSFPTWWRRIVSKRKNLVFIIITNIASNSLWISEKRVLSIRKFDLHKFQNFCLKYFRQVCVFDLVAVTSKSCATRTVVEHSVIERCFDGFSSFR